MHMLTSREATVDQSGEVTRKRPLPETRSVQSTSSHFKAITKQTQASRKVAQYRADLRFACKGEACLLTSPKRTDSGPWVGRGWKGHSQKASQRPAYSSPARGSPHFPVFSSVKAHFTAPSQEPHGLQSDIHCAMLGLGTIW